MSLSDEASLMQPVHVKLNGQSSWRHVRKRQKSIFLSKIIFQNFRAISAESHLKSQAERAKESATAIRTHEPPPA